VATPQARPGERVRRTLFGLFLVQFGLVWSRLWLPWPMFGQASWPEGILLILATATVVASLTRQLPAQNVVLASVIIACAGGALLFGEKLEQQLDCPLSWTVPMLWVVFLLTSRGTAGFMLRRWRQTPNYGFWRLGITALLVLLLDLGLEPFANVQQYWRWQSAGTPTNWYGTPWSHFVALALMVLVILPLVTPVLIKKQPGPELPDVHPVWVWLLVDAFFATAAIVHRLWLAALVAGAGAALVAAMASRPNQLPANKCQ
jgi:uncharacterized membrane protein